MKYRSLPPSLARNVRSGMQAHRHVELYGVCFRAQPRWTDTMFGGPYADRSNRKLFIWDLK